jgi:hypothetical protein
MPEKTYAYVALLDVLGFRALLARDREEGIMTFQAKLRDALHLLTELNELIFQYQAISDTIIVMCGDRSRFVEFAAALKQLTISFLRQQLMVRGGVAYSQHFHSGNVTYSHALALAYELESKRAIYPRIIVDKNIIKLQEEIKLAIPPGLLLEQNGVIFIDFITDTGWQNAYDLAKQLFADQQHLIAGDEMAFSKHLWLQNLLLHHPDAPTDAKGYILSPSKTSLIFAG